MTPASPASNEISILARGGSSKPIPVGSFVYILIRVGALSPLPGFSSISRRRSSSETRVFSSYVPILMRRLLTRTDCVNGMFNII